MLSTQKEEWLDSTLGQRRSLEDSMAEQEAPAPRLVKKVVVAYELKALPLALIQSFNVLRRKIERAGFKVEVALRPLTDLPPEVDVLFVAEELIEVARSAAPEARVMRLTATLIHQPAYDDLLQQLNAGQEIYATRPAAEPTGAPQKVILRYRGNERIN